MLDFQTNLGCSNLLGLKSSLAAAYPGVRPAHRQEALARGLGFSTCASMRSSLKEKTLVTANGLGFEKFLQERGYRVGIEGFYLSIAREAMALAMAQEPFLTAEGIGAINQLKDGKSVPWRGGFNGQRNELLSKPNLRYFVKCCPIISKLSKDESCQSRIRSYPLMEFIDKFRIGGLSGLAFEAAPRKHGIVIAAALHAGFGIWNADADYLDRSFDAAFHICPNSMNKLSADCNDLDEMDIGPKGAARDLAMIRVKDAVLQAIRG